MFWFNYSLKIYCEGDTLYMVCDNEKVSKMSNCSEMTLKSETDNKAKKFNNFW